MRHELVLNRENGTIIRLIVLGSFDFFKNDVDTEVFIGVKSPDAIREEFFHSKILSPEAKRMPLSEYIEQGRVGLLKYVKPSEIIKAILQFKSKYSK
jgi:hypothetical protein